MPFERGYILYILLVYTDLPLTAEEVNAIAGVCLSVCLFVCLLARLLKNAWMDFDEMLRRQMSGLGGSG